MNFKKIILLLAAVGIKDLPAPKPAVQSSTIAKKTDEISTKIGDFSRYQTASPGYKQEDSLSDSEKLGTNLQPYKYSDRVWRYPAHTKVIVDSLLGALCAEPKQDGLRNVYHGGQFPTLPTKGITLYQQIEALPKKGLSITLDPKNPYHKPFFSNPAEAEARSITISKEALTQLASSAEIMLSPLCFNQKEQFIQYCKVVGMGVGNRQDSRLLADLASLLKGKKDVELQSISSTIDEIDANSKQSLDLKGSLDNLSINCGVATLVDAFFLIQQYVPASGAFKGKALYEFRKDPESKSSITIPYTQKSGIKEKPVTIISIPGINANYGAKYLQTKDNAQIWFKLFLNMWTTILQSAVLKGCKILCAPMISGGAFAPDGLKKEFLRCNFLALGILLATIFKDKFDRIYLNPTLFDTDANSAWISVFQGIKGLKQVVSDEGGDLVAYGKDIMFLAIELAKEGYSVALLNPSDADVSCGLRPLGEYVLNLSTNPEPSDMVGEESLALFSTMIFLSRGLGMFKTRDGRVVSIYEHEDLISVLNDPFPMVKLILQKISPYIPDLVNKKEITRDLQMQVNALVGVENQAMIGLTPEDKLTTSPEEAARAFGLTQKDAEQRAAISVRRGVEYKIAQPEYKTEDSDFDPSEYGYTDKDADKLDIDAQTRDIIRQFPSSPKPKAPERRQSTQTTLSSPQTAAPARRTSYGPPSSPSSTSSQAKQSPRGRAVTTITTQFVDDQPPAGASYGSVAPLGAVEGMDDVQPFEPAPRAQAVAAY